MAALLAGDRAVVAGVAGRSSRLLPHRPQDRSTFSFTAPSDGPRLSGDGRNFLNLDQSRPARAGLPRRRGGPILRPCESSTSIRSTARRSGRPHRPSHRRGVGRTPPSSRRPESSCSPTAGSCSSQREHLLEARIETSSYPYRDGPPFLDPGRRVRRQPIDGPDLARRRGSAAPPALQSRHRPARPSAPAGRPAGLKRAQRIRPALRSASSMTCWTPLAGAGAAGLRRRAAGWGAGPAAPPPASPPLPSPPSPPGRSRRRRRSAPSSSARRRACARPPRPARPRRCRQAECRGPFR